MKSAEERTFLLGREKETKSSLAQLGHQNRSFFLNKHNPCPAHESHQRMKSGE